MYELIARQFSADAPFVEPNLAVRLIAGESIRWQGWADVALLRYNRSRPESDRFEFAWSLVEPAEITITERRLIYRANTLSRKFGKAAKLWEGALAGIGGADKFLRPDAFIGQICFPWVSNVILTLEKRFGITFSIVTVTVLGLEAAPLQLMLRFHLGAAKMSAQSTRVLAGALAANIASLRLAAMNGSLSAEELRRLTALRDTGEPAQTPSGALYWYLPAAVPITHRPGTGPPVSALPDLLNALAKAIDNLPKLGASAV